MATTFRTSSGEVLDSICYRQYGTLIGTVEAVLAANPGLAREQQPYRSGVLILLPDLPAPVTETIRLWD